MTAALKHLQDAFGLIGLEDLLVVEQVEPITVIFQQTLLNGVWHHGNLSVADRIVLLSDVVRTGRLEIDPLLKLLLGEFSTVGADGIALLDGGEELLSS